MTQPIRFLVDECLGRPTVESVLAPSLHLYMADAQIAHLLAIFPCGVKDKVWIPKIADDGGWTVITADRGTHSPIGDRLPQICRELCVTHVMLSAGLYKRNNYFRALAIQSNWEGLVKAASEPPGAGYKLVLVGQAHFRLHNVYDALPTPGPEQQGRLFGDP